MNLFYMSRLKSFATPLLVAFTFLAAQPSFAALMGSPFPPYLDDRFSNVETGSGLATGAVTTSKILDATVVGADAAETNAASGNYLKKIAMAVYDTATTGYGSSTTDSGIHSLGVTLPAKAIITRSWLEIITQFTDSGTGTVAISCEDANNIKTATDITGSSAGALIEGQSTGAASAFVTSIASACDMKATVGGVDQTAGKLRVFVEYVTGGS